MLISVPVSFETDPNEEIENNGSRLETMKKDGSWHWWKKLRSLCEESNKLGLVLVLTEGVSLNEMEIERWYSEPIKALLIPTRLFLTNKNGFPVLSKFHQKFVQKFLKVSFILVFQNLYNLEIIFK